MTDKNIPPERVEFGAVMFDDVDTFGIIKAILQSSWIKVRVGNMEKRVSPNEVIKAVEKEVARWIVANSDVLIPRRKLLEIMKSALKSILCRNVECEYAVYDDEGKEVSADKLLDMLLPHTRLYPVHSDLYLLVTFETEHWSHDVGHRLCRVLMTAHKLATMFYADELEYGELVKRVAWEYYNAFSSGEKTDDPLKWYHDKLTKLYLL